MYSISLAGNWLTEKRRLNVSVGLYNNVTTVLQWTFCLEWWSLFSIFSCIKYISWKVTLHFLLRSDPGSFSFQSLLSLLCQTCSYQHRKRTFFSPSSGSWCVFFPQKYGDGWINGPNIIELVCSCGGFLGPLRHRSQPYASMAAL